MGFKIDDSTNMSVTITAAQTITWEGSLTDLPANIANSVRQSLAGDEHSVTIDDALFEALDYQQAHVFLQANGAVDSEEITVDEVTYDV